jgi:hypothetical protein
MSVIKYTASGSGNIVVLLETQWFRSGVQMFLIIVSEGGKTAEILCVHYN